MEKMNDHRRKTRPSWQWDRPMSRGGGVLGLWRRRSRRRRNNNRVRKLWRGER